MNKPKLTFVNGPIAERKELKEELAKHGLKAEPWELNYELRRKLSAARAMDIKVEQPNNSWW